MNKVFFYSIQFHHISGNIIQPSGVAVFHNSLSIMRLFFYFQVLRMMVGVNISDEQLGSIADRTIQEADTNGDSCISFNEFIKASFVVALLSLLIFALLKLTARLFLLSNKRMLFEFFFLI